MAERATRTSLNLHIFWGSAVIAVLIIGIGGWAATARISGAVIASGVLVVDTNVKQVQHSDGGIVGEIMVQDGDQVRSGDVVVRLDATQTRANLAINTKAIDQLIARKARLHVELDGGEAVIFPQQLLDRANDDDVAEVFRSERSLFKLRMTVRLGKKAQLGERVVQYEQEIIGLEAQAMAKAKEVVLIKRELEGARSLWKQQLMPITKLTALEREAIRIDGEGASLLANIAQMRGRISETKMQILQVGHDLGNEVANELGEIAGRLGELEERKIAAEDQLKRIDIRAPQDGTVHQSTAHTIGGVIAAGEDIMLIVPGAENLTVEARVAPQDIDQLYTQQVASLRFSAFSQRETPEVNGKINRISADITLDERSEQSYYTVRISMDATELARLGDVTLVPGMPVEAFIKTEERSIISYLVKPLSDQILRAFREE